MNDVAMLIVASLLLAVGTYLFRLVGPLLADRLQLSARTERLLAVSAVVLLTALVATTALQQDGEFVGFARPGGVLVGGVLAWRKVAFIVVVLAAAATTAGLRALGVP